MPDDLANALICSCLLASYLVQAFLNPEHKAKLSISAWLVIPTMHAPEFALAIPYSWDVSRNCRAE